MGRSSENIIVARGNWGTIVCAVRLNCSIPAEKFLKKLKRERNSDFIKLMVLLERMAFVGKIVGIGRFKHLDEKIYEFKRGQVRMACFQIGNSWVLTHGFIKKRRQWPRKEIERAQKIMREHLKRIAS